MFRQIVKSFGLAYLFENTLVEDAKTTAIIASTWDPPNFPCETIIPKDSPTFISSEEKHGTGLDYLKKAKSSLATPREVIYYAKLALNHFNEALHPTKGIYNPLKIEAHDLIRAAFKRLSNEIFRSYKSPDEQANEHYILGNEYKEILHLSQQFLGDECADLKNLNVLVEEYRQAYRLQLDNKIYENAYAQALISRGMFYDTKNAEAIDLAIEDYEKAYLILGHDKDINLTIQFGVALHTRAFRLIQNEYPPYDWIIHFNENYKINDIKIIDSAIKDLEYANIITNDRVFTYSENLAVAKLYRAQYYSDLVSQTQSITKKLEYLEKTISDCRASHDRAHSFETLNTSDRKKFLATLQSLLKSAEAKHRFYTKLTERKHPKPHFFNKTHINPTCPVARKDPPKYRIHYGK